MFKYKTSDIFPEATPFAMKMIKWIFPLCFENVSDKLIQGKASLHLLLLSICTGGNEWPQVSAT